MLCYPAFEEECLRLKREGEVRIQMKFCLNCGLRQDVPEFGCDALMNSQCNECQEYIGCYRIALGIKGNFTCTVIAKLSKEFE
jgi:hypothetical protein